MSDIEILLREISDGIKELKERVDAVEHEIVDMERKLCGSWKNEV